MRFSVLREALLTPLLATAGLVERRQNLTILSHLLLVVSDQGLTLTSSDQELQLTMTVPSLSSAGSGIATVPARKFLDILRTLPDSVPVNVELVAGNMIVSAGRFKSQLVTLPADDFPVVEPTQDTEFLLPSPRLARLLEDCSFAMAQQDVRHYFNGMLLEFNREGVCAVATNGQRLALSQFSLEEMSLSGPRRFIIPRKGIAELAKLLLKDDSIVRLGFSPNHMMASTERGTLITKLIDATFPDYSRAIPGKGPCEVVADRRSLIDALKRTAILSNEIYRNVRLTLASGTLIVHTDNPLQEEAEEVVPVGYVGEALEIGFNVGYLIEALSAIREEEVRLQFSDPGSAVLITGGESSGKYVVSPMIL